MLAIELTRCTALICDQVYLAEIHSLEKNLELLKQIIVRDDNYEHWLAEQNTEDPAPEINDDDLYYIRFTGATTGTPKGIPTTQHQFLAQGRDWSHLKVLMSVAAPLSEATIKSARKIFGDVLYQGYSESESFPITMMGSQQWFCDIEGSEPLRSAGLALPTADVEIWDDKNMTLPPGEEGEIAVRCEGQIDFFGRTKKKLKNA